MGQYDEYISATVKSENSSRIKYFRENTDQLYANSKADSTKLQQRYKTIMDHINQTNLEIDSLTKENQVKSNPELNGDSSPKLSMNPFPEHVDQRYLTHTMRPVPPEHTNALLSDPNCLGTDAYLKLRWSVPPNKRFYFKETSGMEYGWREPEKSNETFYGRSYNLEKTIWRRNTLAMFVIDKQIPAQTFF